MYLPLKMVIFQCHVSFRWCNNLFQLLGLSMSQYHFWYRQELESYFVLADPWSINKKINNHYSSPMLHPTNKSTRITSWWFQPNWKILVKLDHFPRVRGGNKKYLSCHHLDHHTKNCSPVTQHCIGDFLSLTDLIEQGLPRGLDPVGWQGLEGGLQVCRLRTIRWKVPTNWWGFSWESKSNLFEICLDDIYLNSMSSLVILGGWGLWESKAAYR